MTIKIDVNLQRTSEMTLNKSVVRTIVLSFLAASAALAGEPARESGSEPNGPTRTLAVDYPRPLRQALWELQTRYGVASTYEDPRYQAAVDIESVRAENGGRVLRPAKKQLEVEYPSVAGGAPADPRALVEELVRQHHRRGNPGQFEVRADQGRIEVVPAAVADAGGRLSAQAPVMDSHVSGPGRDASVAQALKSLAGQLEADCGYPVRVFSWSMESFGRIAAAPDPQGGPAREVLARLLESVPAEMTWALVWEPQVEVYMLMVSPVRRGQAASR